jgi:hypothetical protein
VVAGEQLARTVPAAPNAISLRNSLLVIFLCSDMGTSCVTSQIFGIRRRKSFYEEMVLHLMDNTTSQK